MATFNLNNLDLSYYGLYVTNFSVSIDDGIQHLDISMNSTIPTFSGYDNFIRDLMVIQQIRKTSETDLAIKEAFEKLLTVMALKNES